ncbi:MAG: RHS repeat-associated core domain-containing protein [Acidobacteria bacterium]|nr:RHS repeat-associated core domain-containing protein [Acidobacteriota bacterium]
MLDQNNQPIGRYFYDGEGRRVKKVTDLETTVFVYDASSKLIAEYSNQTPQNPNTSYVATDTLLSVRLVTDRSGNVVSRRDFKPFGEDLAADQTFRKTTDNYSTATQDKVRQRFTGYQKDIETGLDFAEARMYENRHGRFTAVDPLLASGKSANPQTFNRYTYVLNSPLVNTDPTGLQTNQASGTGESIKFYLYVRSFAPFDSFGGGFKGDGDNRQFSTSLEKSVTSRMTSVAEVTMATRSSGIATPDSAFVTTRAPLVAFLPKGDAQTQRWSAEVKSIGSHSEGAPGTIFEGFSAESEVYLSDGRGTFDAFETEYSGYGSCQVNYTLYGNDDAFPLGIGDWNVASNIDVNAEINFSGGGIVTEASGLWSMGR